MPNASGLSKPECRRDAGVGKIGDSKCAPVWLRAFKKVSNENARDNYAPVQTGSVASPVGGHCREAKAAAELNDGT